METEEKLAFEMFNMVHDRLGHYDIDLHYFDCPCVKQMWIEVARLVDDIVTHRWNLDSGTYSHMTADDATAEEMYCIVHRRLNDGRDQTSQMNFKTTPPLRSAWLEIANMVREYARLRRVSLDEA